MAFQSDANNLSAEDNPGVEHLRPRGRHERDDAREPRHGLGGRGGHQPVADPSISGDGRFVAFKSEADNLSPDDDDSVRNVFVRDLAANRRSWSAAPRARGRRRERRVERPGDLPRRALRRLRLGRRQPLRRRRRAFRNVFVRDLVANTTPVSRRSGASGAAGDDVSFIRSSPATATGSPLAPLANNLSDEDDDDFDNVFPRDLASARTR